VKRTTYMGEKFRGDVQNW